MKQDAKAALSFSYPFRNATVFPSKQTATQLKGRMKDQEVQQDAKQQKVYYSWRKPSFADSKSVDALAVGTATHKALQFLRIDGEPTDEALDIALTALRNQGRLQDNELALIDKNAIAIFFRSPLGRKILSSENVLREFKFSILVDAAQFDASITEDSVLLQGVVDCAVIEEDGITVVDFKTDSVTEETVVTASEGYRMQIQAYAHALSRIYALPVKRLVLYFLHIGKEMDIL